MKSVSLYFMQFISLLDTHIYIQYSTKPFNWTCLEAVLLALVRARHVGYSRLHNLNAFGCRNATLNIFSSCIVISGNRM